MISTSIGYVKKPVKVLNNALFCLFSILLVGISFAAPPYDITVTFSPPSAGPVPDSYNLYIDDCAVTGPTGVPFSTVTSGQTFAGALTADGVYQVCVRSVNATGENPDPGPVASIDVADLPLSSPVENLDVTVACPNGGCTVTVTVN